jgi:hypothetical protein
MAKMFFEVTREVTNHVGEGMRLQSFTLKPGKVNAIDEDVIGAMLTHPVRGAVFQALMEDGTINEIDEKRANKLAAGEVDFIKPPMTPAELSAIIEGQKARAAAEAPR